MALDRILLAEVVDYAGLFPPAALSMEQAVAEYARERTGPDAWALGRFVVPAPRLSDFANALGAGHQGDPWPTAVTAASREEAIQITGAMSRQDGTAARFDAAELRAGAVPEAKELLAIVPRSLVRFVEIPVGGEQGPLLSVLRSNGAGAKFRTGGVTPDAFPSPEALLDSLASCIQAQLPFKCTAGLHHPVRGVYPLTYAEDSLTSTMFGYLNVMFAAAGLLAGWTRAEALAALLDEDRGAFTLTADRLAWRGRVLTEATIRGLRQTGLQGFGSCSFREPMSELAALGAA